jgi:hypothetical protein
MTTADLHARPGVHRRLLDAADWHGIRPRDLAGCVPGLTPDAIAEEAALLRALQDPALLTRVAAFFAVGRAWLAGGEGPVWAPVNFPTIQELTEHVGSFGHLPVRFAGLSAEERFPLTGGVTLDLVLVDVTPGARQFLVLEEEIYWHEGSSWASETLLVQFVSPREDQDPDGFLEAWAFLAALNVRGWVLEAKEIPSGVLREVAAGRKHPVEVDRHGAADVALPRSVPGREVALPLMTADQWAALFDQIVRTNAEATKIQLGLRGPSTGQESPGFPQPA